MGRYGEARNGSDGEHQWFWGIIFGDYKCGNWQELGERTQ